MIAALLILGSCPHPYLPLSSGGTWTYQLSDGAEVTLAVGEIESGDGWQTAQVGSFTDAGATAPVATTTFLCSDEGVVLPLGAAALAGRARVETLEERGVSLPGDAKPGAEWQSSRVLRIDSVTTALSSKHRIVREETAKTPAGAFKALRVEVVTASSRVRGKKPEVHRTTLWFARDVGLVKTEGDVDMVLVRRGRR